MPRGNGTGPSGFGPMTGRGAGYCAGYNAPGYANGFAGRGGAGMRRGQGFGGGGRGRGFRGQGFGYAGGFGAGPFPAQGGYNYPQQEFSPEAEMNMLKNEAQAMENELKFIKERMAELEGLNKGTGEV